MTDDRPTNPTAASGVVITPAEIQQQEFAVTRFGGYRMRDVDEFLDRLTGSAEAILAENERLRAGGSPIVGTSDLDDVNRQADEIVQRARDEAARIIAEANERVATTGGAAATGAVSGSTPSQRVAVDAFLSQERDFLQSLATLVQGHAESVKGMAKRARASQAAEAAAPVVVGEAAETPDAPDAMKAGEATQEHKDEPEAQRAVDQAPAPQPRPASPTQGGPDREREGDPSLKQLFWGEEN